MPLVSATCPKCGSVLEVDSDQEAAVCPACGTPYIVEKAINIYKTTNHITADVVNVYEKASPDFVIRGGILVDYCGESPEVIIPDNVKIIGKDAFVGYAGITSIHIPEGVTEIQGTNGTYPSTPYCGAFSGCKGLREITLPRSLRIIGKGVFRDCIGLEKVHISKGVSSILGGAFWGCKALKEISLPDSVEEIGDYAFYRCESLQNVLFSPKVRKIGGSSFSECKSLKQIEIPDSVIEVGTAAFLDCDSLERVVLGRNVEHVCNDVFKGCRSLREIEIKGNTEFSHVIWHDDDIPWANYFPACDYPNLSIIAPEEWKQKYWQIHISLSAYNPDKQQPPNSTSGCFVATAVYGSYDCPEVWVLRRYRDNKLLNTILGRAFVKTYYFVSPKLVKLFGDKAWFNRYIRAWLDRIVARLHGKGYSDSPYSDR